MEHKDCLSATTPNRLASRQEMLKGLAAERILLVGIPGAGKTTTATLLGEEYEDFNYISLGDISRNLPSESEDAQQLRGLFKAGEPSGLVSFFLKLVDLPLRQVRDTGFIFDGIPKTPGEVSPLFQYMDSSLHANFSLVLHLQISPEVAIDRIDLRGVQDSKDSQAMYRKRIARYEPTIQELYKISDRVGLPWVSVRTDLMQPNEVIADILGQYADIAPVRH